MDFDLVAAIVNHFGHLQGLYFLFIVAEVKQAAATASVARSFADLAVVTTIAAALSQVAIK